jgi:hypothetical protein
MGTFDSTKRSLPDVLSDITSGKIQLPDFQRGWIWDDNHVRSLLASVARSFPIGAVMLLETGGDVRFQIRPIEHITFEKTIPDAESLILDGQQRLTTLTQVLKIDRPVKTRNSKGRAIERFYYFDITKILEGEDIEEAIVAVESDRKVKSNFGKDIALDLSTRQLECQNFYFPCTEIINADKWEESLLEFAQEKFQDYSKFRRQILNAFRTYQLPIIELKKETTREAVCLVFEKVNTGGVPLSVFELITATYAADAYNLRDDWFGSEIRNVPSRQARIHQEPLLSSIEATNLLETIALLHTYEKRQQDIVRGKTGKQVAAVSAKRSAILSLPLSAYQQWVDKAEKGFITTAQFLRQECFYSVKDLPYSTQVPALAAILTHLDDNWRTPKVKDKLSQWFWCGVLGELYGGSVETRIANDLEEILAWVKDDTAIPRTVSEAIFQPNRLLSLRSRQSAAYKGLHTLVLRERAKDFFYKSNIRNLEQDRVAIDIHHIFPRKWCESNNIEPKIYNSIVNKTPISFKANHIIGGSAPSRYLAVLQTNKNVQLDDSAMDAILASHFIDPAAMRSDDFQAFFDRRFQSLLTIISKAMGKKIDLDLPTDPDHSYDDDEQANYHP